MPMTHIAIVDSAQSSEQAVIRYPDDESRPLDLLSFGYSLSRVSRQELHPASSCQAILVLLPPPRTAAPVVFLFKVSIERQGLAQVASRLLRSGEVRAQ